MIAAKEHVKVKTRKYMLSKYENCFVASELIDWLVSDGVCVGRRAAVALAASMASIGLLQHVVDKEKPFADGYLFFRFVENAPELIKSKSSSLLKQTSSLEEKKESRDERSETFCFFFSLSLSLSLLFLMQFRISCAIVYESWRPCTRCACEGCSERCCVSHGE